MVKIKCVQCKRKAIFIKPTLCKKHFCLYIEKKVYNTIKKYKLITKKDRLVVGVSGGKDSLTILYLLHKYTKNIVALCINEGIYGYREATIKDMKSFCIKYDIPFIITSYKEEFGMALDEMLQKLNEKPCTVCGSFRRYLLNKKSREFGATKLVTGHNMDDEAQAILMNLFKHQTEILMRLGPLTGILKDTQFIPRIKPLYFITEKETAAYSFLMDFNITYNVCPNAVHAYRGVVGTFLNDVEEKYTGSKKCLINQFIKQLPKIKAKTMKKFMRYCVHCHEPSMQNICKTCKYLAKIRVPQHDV